MIELHVQVRSHHFIVYNFSEKAHIAIKKYAWTFVQWGIERKGRGFVSAPIKTFAARNKVKPEYRFHIHVFKDFIRFMEGAHVGTDKMRITKAAAPNVDVVHLPLFPNWIPKEDQPAAIEYICKEGDPVSRVVLLDPGKGKSFISMYSISKLMQRFVLVTKAGYLDNWYINIKKTYDIPEEDIYLVQGSNSLIALIAKAKAGEPIARVILISNKTIANFIKLYEEYGDGISELGYDCTPDEFFPLLGGGYRIIDELHQEFHFNFKLDLYTHTSTVLGLTGTLISDDQHITRMHDVAYPIRDRFKGSKYVPYIRTVAVLYNIKTLKGIRTTTDGKTYSHIAFEQSIMTRKELLNNYLEMVYRHVYEYFICNKERKPEDRFIVFCSTVDLCTIMTNYIHSRISRLGLEAMRYVKDDPTSNLMEPDGRVSTLLSAGTAVDIPKLTHVFLTTSVDSSPSNIQGHGRLRELKDGRNPTFVYFSCSDIEKQVKYHNNKKDFIRERSLSFNEMHYGKYL